MNFRTILPQDNKTLASVIRRSLETYNLNIPGTVYTDPTTDHLYELFQQTGSVYFVAENEEGEVVGGCGLYPTKGLPQGHVELVKLYLNEKARGRGLGRALMERCHQWARENGLTHVYLETMDELRSALILYQSLGYTSLPGSLGDSGHHACTIWMLKKL